MKTHKKSEILERLSLRRSVRLVSLNCFYPCESSLPELFWTLGRLVSQIRLRDYFLFFHSETSLKDKIFSWETVTYIAKEFLETSLVRLKWVSETSLARGKLVLRH